MRSSLLGYRCIFSWERGSQKTPGTNRAPSSRLGPRDGRGLDKVREAHEVSCFAAPSRLGATSPRRRTTTVTAVIMLEPDLGRKIACIGCGRS